MPLLAWERPGVEFKVFHFPASQIPRIDGKVDDWAMDRKDLEVDGSLSGGPFITHMPPVKDYDPKGAHFTFHGMQAQK